jgi:hypothetical protein
MSTHAAGLLSVGIGYAAVLGAVGASRESLLVL